jgi:Double zinc ribbon
MTLAANDSLFDSGTWDVARNVAILLGVVFWLATVYWVFKDARRRIEDPWLVAMATVLGAVPPFLGPLIYMLFRPPEYLEDVRERELEMLAMEERLAEHDLRCPVCRGAVEASFLVCPVCTTRLKQACTECAAPLEPIWQVCPYCATRVPPGVVTGEDVLQPVRPRRSRRAG